MIAPSSAPATIVAAAHRDDRPAQDVERVERAEVGQREHRSDREVDAAHDDDQRLAESDEPDLRRLPCGVGEARRRKEVVDRLAQREADDEEDDDGDRRLGPTLGEDLAKQMVRPIPVTPTSEGFAHRGPGDWRDVSGGRRWTHRADRRGVRRRTVRYFFRSLRFQHAVWEPAFSFVMGIRVV